MEKGISVIFYHGADDRQEKSSLSTGESVTQTHIDIKKKHFKNVNMYWKNY